MQTPSILIVEDEIQTANVIKNSLRAFFGCCAQVIDNGKEAIENIKQNNYDLVILDIKMPGLSGIDVLRNLKNAPNRPDFLVITAWDSEQVADEAIKEGVRDYIIKPVELGTLKEKVEAILKKRNNPT
ncbi:MAG: response regulator [Candidatus Omnitrophota bacterium]